MMKFQNRENMLALGGFLGAVALAAALVLALVSQWTAGPIKAAHERNRDKVFKRLLLPGFDRVGGKEELGGCSFLPVLKEGREVGFIGQGASRAGYGGEIEALVGFDLAGKITAVQIIRHKETPGLGANVCERKFQRTLFNLSAEAPEVPENRLLDQYAGLAAERSGGWKISKDGGNFEYRTGATVTSRAVTALVDGIAGKFVVWRAHREGDEKR